MTKLVCPECGTEEVLGYEKISYKINTCEFYCYSVKFHDSDAEVRCMDCEFVGRRDQLKELK